MCLLDPHMERGREKEAECNEKGRCSQRGGEMETRWGQRVGETRLVPGGGREPPWGGRARRWHQSRRGDGPGRRRRPPSPAISLMARAAPPGVMKQRNVGDIFLNRKNAEIQVKLKDLRVRREARAHFGKQTARLRGASESRGGSLPLRGCLPTLF